MKVRIKDLQLGKNWARSFGTGDIKELAASMKELGQIAPITVDDVLNVLCGYRRIAAAISLDWADIEVTVNNTANPKVLNLVENLCRDDPSLWEEIQGIRDVFGTNPAVPEICRQLSKSRTWVKPRVEIWNLPEDFITKVRLGHAGVADIRGMLTEKRGPSAQAKNMGHPSQPDIKRMITWLTKQKRMVEANALSFAVGGLSEQQLKDIDYDQ